jgi:alkanesulfonate monooxygenase SsuD/methylene tetrahydromethanopterin reductase-like flavin-dependent oxidoreductase (luciferase family)
MVMCAMRFDLRAPAFGPASARDIYAACLDMSQWAESQGFDILVLSEHHGVDDQYLSAPLAMAGVIAGRTRTIPINIAALLVPLHDPIRLAEELAVLDLATGGRVSIVAGAGYRREEFEMAGVEYKARGKLLEEYIGVMQTAWKGEPFEWRGRTVQVTPVPMSRPHPMIMIGGSTEVAARRSARLGLPLFPAIGDPQLKAWYDDEAAKVGFEGGFVILPSGPSFVYVTEDPDRAWSELAPYLLHEVQTYDSWQTGDQRSAVHLGDATIDGLRAAEDQYWVVTPDECIERAGRLGSLGSLVFHPMIGGCPPELAWPSLELAAAEVLPKLRVPA